MSTPTFDERVAAFRGKVEPKQFSGKKATATPEQWAACLDYAAMRYRRPEVKAKQAEAHARRNRTAEAKARKREYDCRPEVRAKKREYQSRYIKAPEARRKYDEWAKRYRQRQDVKSKKLKYMSGYCRRTEVRIARSEYFLRYSKSRRSSDSDFRLRDNLRARLFAALRKSSRSGSAVRDLGCSVAELKARLESQFAPGMTWENWGKGLGTWQIDHIYPLAAADLTDRTQFLAVANWRNLQPLWSEDNNAKGDRVTPAAQALFDRLVAEFSTAAA